MPMKIGTEKFSSRVEKGIHNDFARAAVVAAQDRFQLRRIAAAEELGHWEEWRSHGEEIRKHVLENLDYYLYELSENVSKRGGHVFFAQTAEEANQYIVDVVKKRNGKKIVKSKSMVTEEINLNAALEKAGCDVVETDLGEFILQLDHDLPSHIVGPSLHKNRHEVQAIFKEKHGYKNSDQAGRTGFTCS